ncbi:hypothetical protein KFK09_020431 [Dendrobium nobile]|uniref:CCHC-type domain-containing protein n=1 Tax=Dendrobium nobile TaxID=94219 RepID=A0A8T3ALB3_DENNO|nr:hypothetical protein KFK09_020431 [Dendrobium nobile]
MAVIVRRPLNAGGTTEDRRSNMKLINGSSRPMLSPPTFGDGKVAFSEIYKTTGNKGIVINEGGFVPRKEPKVIGKGKTIALENNGKEILKRRTSSTPTEGHDVAMSSKSIEKIKVSNWQESPSSNIKEKLEGRKNAEDLKKSFETEKILFSELVKVREVDSTDEGANADAVHFLNGDVGAEKSNVWSKKENIKVSELQLGNFIAEDGFTVKLHEENEIENAEKLRNSIVIKVFGGDPPLRIISSELRTQWMQFGKFCLTMLGMGRVLCSFYEPEHVEAVMTNGPWFVNGRIIGMDKWTQKFSTNSLKGLTSPIWIRLPNLPLHCWDNINLCRIASMVGKPYLIDGNMYQWGRREFGRICVRIQLDNKLPLGVWVEGRARRFYQRIEYERIPNFCFKCGLIGHNFEECKEGKEVNAKTDKVDVSENVSSEIISEESGYGPWLIVNRGRKKIIHPTQNPVIFHQQQKSINNKWRKKEAIRSPEKAEKMYLEIVPTANEAHMITVVEDEIPVDPPDKSIKESSNVNTPDIQCSEDVSITVKKKKSKQLKDMGPVSLNLRNRRMEMVAKVGLLETKLTLIDRKEVNNLIGEGWDYTMISSNGLSGGIFVLWDTNVAVFNMIDSSNQCIIGDLLINNNKKWRVAAVYSNKECSKRRELWDKLVIHSSVEDPMVIAGDFNCLTSREDKKGGRRFKFTQGSKEMESFFTNNDFHEVNFIGPRFTWCNNKIGGARILERLDRCFLNSNSLNLSSNLVLKHLVRIASDHCPIILSILLLKPSHVKIIKFEDVWTSYLAALKVVKKAWAINYEGSLAHILNSKFRRSLFFWSKAKKISLNLAKDKLMEEILDLQNLEAERGQLSNEDCWRLKTKVLKLNSTLARLNTWWKQRAKAKWMNDGDCNSKFFHSYASAKRRLNNIVKLKDDEGNVMEDQSQIEDILIKIFKQKWRYRGSSTVGWPNPNFSLNESDRTWLDRGFTVEEVELVIKDLGSHIAPGFDGITFSFIKSYWDIIKLDSMNAINFFLVQGEMDNTWKETLIVLIPKILNPLLPINFRPISHCNSIYKVAAKVLLNRLIMIIPKIISEEQAAFIQGRSISDHFLIAQEVFHKFGFSNSNKGLVAYKIDMEQAYDSMSWGTLEGVLKYFDFPPKFSKLILECVLKPRYSIIINGNQTEWISAMSSFRQGCPLPPFLYIMCSQLLSNALAMTSIGPNGEIGIHYVKWEELCKPVIKGGRGLISPSSKVAELRARISWRFLNRISFLFKILVTKYGYRIDEGNYKKNMSPSWKIIKDGCNALQPFLKWSVGNGSSIKVFDDIWLLDRRLNEWPTYVVPQEEDIKVFSEDMVELIIRTTSLNSQLQVDRQELIYKGAGKTVSGMIAESRFKDMPDCRFSKWLKKAKLNPRIEIFCWRLFKDTIPTNHYLAHRRLQEEEDRPRCMNGIEDIDHIICKCSKIKEAFNQVNKWVFGIPLFDNLHDCCNWMDQITAPNGMILNLFFNFTHDKENVGPVSVAAEAVCFSSISKLMAKQYLEQWDVNQPVRLSNSWHPPPPEWLKINVDASLDSTYRVGIGGVIRDSKGRIGDRIIALKIVVDDKIVNIISAYAPQSDGEIDGDIISRIQVGWLKWRNASGLLCDRNVPLELKGKFYKMVVRPVMLYGAECWPLKEKHNTKLSVAEMRMLRWMSDFTLRDRIRNEHIRGKVRVAPVEDKIRESRLRWFGHIKRRPSDDPDDMDIILADQYKSQKIDQSIALNANWTIKNWLDHPG